MTRNTIVRLAGTAVATAFASLALASPAAAIVTPDPVGTTGVYQEDTTSAISSDGIAWTEVGVGAVTALAVGGAAVAATSMGRRRYHHAAQG